MRLDLTAATGTLYNVEGRTAVRTQIEDAIQIVTLKLDPHGVRVAVASFQSIDDEYPLAVPARLITAS